MAQERPTFIDLAGAGSRVGSRAGSAASTSRHGFPSPRIQHYDGDVPPSLSPLDAFAAHSRRLAKDLEEIRIAGERRMSRLPPQHVKQSLNDHQKNRPPVFRALSDGGEPVPPLPQFKKEGSGANPEIQEPKTRPVSSYPRISAVVAGEDLPDSDAFYTPRESYIGDLHQMSVPGSYFEAPRSESPPPLEQVRTVTSPLSHQPSSDSHPDLTFTLAPPNAAFARTKLHHESSDDDYTSSNAGSTFSRPRKLSSSSGISAPQSPTSAHHQLHERSPSNNSVRSFSDIRNRRSHMNFSRPMSSAGLAAFLTEGPTRKASKSSQASKTSSNIPTLPMSPTSFDDVRPEMSDGFVSGAASSYTHATYTLPRGRMGDRTSAVFLGLSTPHFEWQEPMFPATPTSETRPSYEGPFASPGLPTPSKQDAEPKTEPSDFAFNFQPKDLESVKEVTKRPSTSRETPTSSNDLTSSRPRPSTSHTPAIRPVPPPIPAEPKDDVSHSSRSTSTVRPTTAKSVSNYQALSPEEHVTKAIELHQHGDLKESTYHLRIAAKQDHATAMLLYALACRHGWGMRPNQKEGVQWLRKAVDIAMLEVADDEDPTTGKPKADFNEKKAHRAQFALSIYELGVSHLNGWGIEQDKALALRCFEIAGNWGDTDALSEAGYCYAEGIGCKKDMKKAARFYRMAEARGVSMIGNSWIHKDKYNDEESGNRKSRSFAKTSSDKPRNKSKTRSIFARKKSTTT